VCIVPVAACGTPTRDASPAEPTDTGSPADAGTDAGDTGPAADADARPADAGNVGCNPWFYADHNGCHELSTKPIDGRCDPRNRAPLLDGLGIEDLDTLAPRQGRPGQRHVKERRLLVQGTVEVAAPGKLEVQASDQAGPRVVLDPGLPEGEVLLVNHGQEVILEYLESVERIMDRRGEVALREDASYLLRISATDGTLVYAAGDPFVPVRAVEANLQALGLEIAAAIEPVCGYAQYDGMSTEVGWCLIYRRNVGYQVWFGGSAAQTVMSGESFELEDGARRYRVESGDSFLVEDSDDNCNVPPKTELRITRVL